MCTDKEIKEIYNCSCSECKRKFGHELVWFTWYRNSYFCDECKEIMNERASESYLDWQQRQNIKI